MCVMYVCVSIYVCMYDQGGFPPAPNFFFLLQFLLPRYVVELLRVLLCAACDNNTMALGNHRGFACHACAALHDLGTCTVQRWFPGGGVEWSGVEWRGGDQTEHVHTCDKFKIIYMTRKSTGTQEQLEQEGKKERKKERNSIGTCIRSSQNIQAHYHHDHILANCQTSLH